MRTKYLSQREREKGRKYYFRFSSFNGMAFSFLGTTTVSLLAILYGANNTLLGLISSIPHITGVFLIFFPRLFKGRSSRRVGFVAWLTRGLVCLGYFSLPFLHKSWSLPLIVVVYTIFCLTRTIGVAVQQGIQKMISSTRTRGQVVMTSNSRLNQTALFSRLVSFGITSLQQLSDLTSLLTLQFLGVLSNTFASMNMRKIPNREIIEYNRGEHPGKVFVKAMGSKRERTTLLLRWHSIGIEILVGMTIPFLRIYGGFSSAEVFLYSLLMTMGAITGALFLRPFVDRLGSRPFIMPLALMQGVIFILWMTINPHGKVGLFYFLGFITVFTQTMLVLLSSRLFIQILPDKGSTAYSSMDIFITSLLAFSLGLSGGLLADLSLKHGTLGGLNVYGLTFSLGLLLSLGMALLSIPLIENGSATFSKTLAMLFSMEHMRTFRDISRLEGTKQSEHKRKTLILSLAYTGSNLASQEIRHIFYSPIRSEKAEIMRTLFERERPELIPDLIREAQESASLYRQEAIFALGAYPTQEVEKALIKLLEDQDSFTVSNAAKSLGRIGHTEMAPIIWERYRSLPRGDIHCDVNYIIGLHNMDPEGEWLEGLFSVNQTKRGEWYEQTIFTLVSRLEGMDPPLGWIYQENNGRPGEGIIILLDEAREMAIFNDSRQELEELYDQGDYPALWRWCVDQIPSQEKLQGGLDRIASSIKAFDQGYANPSNTIGVIFFVYQILSRTLV